jgi:hypothetical protein
MALESEDWRTPKYHYRKLDYALETLQIEKHRLVRAIREMRAMPVSGDDYPAQRIKDHGENLEAIEIGITLFEGAIESSRIAHERERAESDKRMRESEAARFKPSKAADPDPPPETQP